MTELKKGVTDATSPKEFPKTDLGQFSTPEPIHIYRGSKTGGWGFSCGSTFSGVTRETDYPKNCGKSVGRI